MSKYFLIDNVVKFDLQLFAEPTDKPTDEPTDEPTNEPANEPTNEPTDEPVNKPTDKPVKTFTQDEVNALIKKRLARESDKWSKSFKETEEYKKFENWVETNKTEQQKLDEKLKSIETVQNENSELKKQLNDFNNKNLLLKSGVSSDYSDFVLYKLNNVYNQKKSENEDISFNDVLKEFKEDKNNNKYFESSPTKFQPTGRVQGKGKVDNLDSYVKDLLSRV